MKHIVVEHVAKLLIDLPTVGKRPVEPLRSFKPNSPEVNFRKLSRPGRSSSGASNRELIAFALLLITLVIAAGCSKQPEAAVGSPQTESGGAIVANSEEATAPKEVAPVFAASDSALKQGEYIKAAQALLALQQQSLSQGQTEEVNAKILGLKRNLGHMIKTHTANDEAWAAIDLLRNGGP